MNTSMILGASPLTMISREIAELLEKQHGNIKISAERLSDKGVIGTLALQEFTHNGNTYTEYLLNKVLEPIAAAGIETELIQVGGKAIRGCMACGKCRENQDRKCVIASDMGNEVIAKLLARR